MGVKTDFELATYHGWSDFLQQQSHTKKYNPIAAEQPARIPYRSLNSMAACAGSGNKSCGGTCAGPNLPMRELPCISFPMR